MSNDDDDDDEKDFFSSFFFADNFFSGKFLKIFFSFEPKILSTTRI